MADIYNPIVSREELSRWQILNKTPVPDANTALVFVGNGQPLLTVSEGQKGLTRGEMLWGRYHFVYKVDMSDFPIGFSCNLPCATDAFDFQAEVQFTCSVRDPEMIVRRNVMDIRQILKHLIIEVMRRVSRKYEVEQSAAAEREVSDSVKTAIYDEGFNLKQFTVILSLEEEAREWIRKRKRLQEAAKLQLLQQELERKRIRQSNKFELEQVRQREQFQLEIMKQKTEFYTAMLQAGQWQLLALQLAQSPEDVPVILQTLNQQKQIEREHQVKMLKMLLDSDAVEGWQLSEVGKRALQELIGFTEQSPAALESAPTNNTERKENRPTADEVFPDEE